jgi:hypothetical protein
VFLFSGLNPRNPSASILQPVLQWGVSHIGGGPYWTIASWFVIRDGDAFHSDLVRVNEGDSLEGTIRLVGRANNAFEYVVEFTGIATTRLSVSSGDELMWCNETLEAYSIGDCADYPATNFETFGQINLKNADGVPSVSWTGVCPVADCGQRVVVPSNSGANGQIDLYF